MQQIYLPLVLVGLLVILYGLVRLRRASIQNFILTVIGAIIGLVFGALASIPLSQLPHPYGQSLPLIFTIVLVLSFIAVVFAQRRLFTHFLPFLQERAGVSSPGTSKPKAGSEILVDTSVIIDGRIADIASVGFVPGRLLVPRFVLAELQNIADSEDAMRRGRGRRGLEVLNRLRETAGIEIEIIEQDAPEIKEVDHKLVALAKIRSCDVLTTDYNLNRVAQIQGVRVLNVNELANAIRPVVIPGEELLVHVVQPGKERGQGVGYLADGTMIVVDNGDKLIGQDVATEVTRVFQTVAGKMIFAVPKGQDTNGNGKSRGGRKAQTLEPSTSEVAPSRERATENGTGQNENRNKGRRHHRNQTAEDRLLRAAAEAAETAATEQ